MSGWDLILRLQAAQG